MAYGFPYQQPPVPGYFNTNYMPQMQQPVQQIPQISQQPSPTLQVVPDELTALNAQFPMDGSPVYFANANGQEIYSKQLSMANGSVIFQKFKRAEEQKPEAPNYVTREELEAKVGELYQLIGSVTAPGGESK